MKKFIFPLLTFCFLLAEFSSAQNYHPFPTTNAAWNTVGDNMFSGQHWKFRYAIFGDTIIDSVEYHKVYSMYDSTILHPNSTYFAGIRENNNRQVFCLLPGFDEVLLFDFNLDVGDTIWYDVGGAMCNDNLSFSMQSHYKLVTAIDSFQLKNGQYRKKWELSGFINDVWVEGVGSLNPLGLFHPLISDIALCGDSYQLACHKQDNMLLYLNNPDCNRCFCDLLTMNQASENLDNKHFEAYPNPASTLLTIRFNEDGQTNHLVRITNSQGAVVSHRQSQGPVIIFRIDDFASGLYHIHVYDEEKNSLGIKKLIIN